MLLALLVADIKRKLEKQAIDAILPAIKAEVAAAVAELEPHIRSHVDPMGQDLTVQFLFKEPQPKK